MPFMNHNLDRQMSDTSAAKNPRYIPQIEPNKYVQQPTVTQPQPQQPASNNQIGGLVNLNTHMTCPCCGRSTEFGFEYTVLVKQQRNLPGTSPGSARRVQTTPFNYRVCRTCTYCLDLPDGHPDNQFAYQQWDKYRKVLALLGEYELYQELKGEKIPSVYGTISSNLETITVGTDENSGADPETDGSDQNQNDDEPDPEQTNETLEPVKKNRGGRPSKASLAQLEAELNAL